MAEMGPDQPTLLICLGATKAGTSWLYDYLKAHPDCFLREIKELNYFDSLSEKGLEHRTAKRDKKRRMAEKQLEECKWYDVSKRRSLRQRIIDWEAWHEIDPDAANHASYYEFLCHGRKVQKLVADVTPSYMMLGEDEFRAMARVAPDVRFVFLLRDPVDRVWSHIRMNAYRKGRWDGTFGDEIQAQIERFVSGKNARMHACSDYTASLQKLDASVDPEKLHICFFEQLFDPVTGPSVLQELTDFLGIRPWKGPLGEASHQSPSFSLDADARRRIRAELQPQYEFCDRYFGASLPERWRQNMTRIEAA